MNIQRRRAVLVSGGALAIALVIAGGVALLPAERPVAKPVAVATSVTTTTSSPSKPAETAPPPAAAIDVKAAVPVLDHFGYQGLKLGMSRDQAMGTGLITKGESNMGPNFCSSHDLVDFPNADNETSLFISDSIGVSTIFAAESMRTTEGIGIGSTRDEVKAAYPNLDQAPNGQFGTDLADNPHARYFFGFDKNWQVRMFFLTHDGQPCHN